MVAQVSYRVNMAQPAPWRTGSAVRKDNDIMNRRISELTEGAIRYAYTSRGEEKGRPLRADDFDAKLQQPEPTPPK